MHTAEVTDIPPMEAEAMAVPPFGTSKRPLWDICWRSKRALVLMGVGCALQWLLAFLVLRYITP